MTPAQVFSSEFCKILKNKCFYRTPLDAAFVTWRCIEYPAKHLHKVIFCKNEKQPKIVISEKKS